jgi:threonine dehydratase
MTELVSFSDILQARERIAATAVRTPLPRLNRARVRMAGFAELSERMPDIYLKDESAQPIRSFKLRGAYNTIAQLSADELKRGVITYSSGNHAQGVAYAARALGAKAVIVMPSTTPKVKQEATAALGAEIVMVGPASAERKAKAEELAAQHGYTVVPPYDDDRIIAGQATCGVEIMEQLGWDEFSHVPDALVLAPVSGGGLLSGVAAGVKLWCQQQGLSAPAVWGVEPELAADATESFRTGTLVEWPAEKTTRTLADGLRTQSLGERNFTHILRYVDGFVNITEEELRSALRILLTATSLTVEPSGAVALAGALFHAHELPPARKIVAIVSGGNIDPALREQVQNEAAAATV